MRIRALLGLVLLGAAPDPFAGLPQPTPGKAQIVFFRGRAWSGRTISCAVSENGAKATPLPPGTFATIQIEPGAHQFSVGGSERGRLEFSAAADQSYFAECTVGMDGILTKAHLRASTREAFMEAYPRLKPAS